MGRGDRERSAGPPRTVGRRRRRLPAGRRARRSRRAINESLGNAGTTVTYATGLEAAPAGAGTIAELAQAMDAGQVEMLVILGGNPVFTAPADLKFAERLSKVGLTIYHGALRRRDRVSLSLARARNARARELGRRARLRRHRHHHAAAHRAALRGALGARSARRRSPLSPTAARRTSSRTTGPARTAAASAAGRCATRRVSHSRTPTRSGAAPCTTGSSPAPR